MSLWNFLRSHSFACLGVIRVKICLRIPLGPLGYKVAHVCEKKKENLPQGTNAQAPKTQCQGVGCVLKFFLSGVPTPKH